MERTTIAIRKDIADRVLAHADELGNKSTSAMVEFMLRKACDFIEAQGYDKFIGLANKINKRVHF